MTGLVLLRSPKNLSVWYVDEYDMGNRERIEGYLETLLLSVTEVPPEVIAKSTPNSIA
jgi:hypothetical protein